ncbi:MAG: hypothetical protein UV60_C0004G0079 [Parcubacteria group bacterium GW2011_GWA2_43_11]|nr:MAG: hypothetical protein UU89_C0036G0006 [Parcubacteria group bacterium GW2011_GWC2_42_11]KKS86002.1 MAG: hypothetical protein UV60_C0004G0079 [Parcubacteria group bacterium GW2011_GWA2_43_11]
MALTEGRRNEIAWLFFLHHLRNRGKIYSVQETCDYFSKKYKIPNDEQLRLVVDGGYHEVLFPNSRPKNPDGVSVRNELAWLLHILFEFKKGIKIGESFSRDIGNRASEIYWTQDVVRLYYIELIVVITNLLNENKWWQTYEDPSLRLESLRAIAAKRAR